MVEAHSQKNARVSVEEYLAIEQQNNLRYEFHNGELFAMAGGTYAHGRISGNVFGQLFARLAAGDCEVINSEIKLYISTEHRFLYPDAMVICGGVEHSEIERNAVTNPVVIIEVLSKGTADYDRGDKFYFYRQLPSLKEYILMEQDIAVIDCYQRHGDLWKISRVEGLEETLHIPSLDIAVPFKEIYQNVTFPAK